MSPNDRNRFHSLSVINRKGLAEKVFCLADIDDVCNHAHWFNKGKTKNEIDSDIGTGSN